MVTFLAVLLIVHTFRNLLGFTRVCNHVARNKPNFSSRAIGIINFEKHFLNFIADTIIDFQFNVGLKTLLREGLSEPEYYGDLVYKFQKLIGRSDFSFQFRKIITPYRRIGYKLNVMRQSAFLVFNPIMVANYAAF